MQTLVSIPAKDNMKESLHLQSGTIFRRSRGDKYVPKLLRNITNEHRMHFRTCRSVSIETIIVATAV
eukprot:scaffold14974_cov195-Amphora_coffeaeformis.AAC.3